METRMTMIVNTIINSRSVKPLTASCSEWPRIVLVGVMLPIRIARPIQGSPLTLGVDVKHVVAAPTPGVRVILHRAQSPVRVAGERVQRDLAQELVFRRGSSFQRNPFHQGREIRRVAKRVSLGRNHATVAKILIAVNCLPEIPQILPQRSLSGSLGLHPGEGERHTCEQQKNCNRSNQFNQRECLKANLLTFYWAKRSPHCGGKTGWGPASGAGPSSGTGA